MYSKRTFQKMENKLYEMLPPILGTWYFVDPENGDDSRLGRTRAEAVQTLRVAHDDLCVSGNGDGICLLSSGITTANTTTRITTSLDWTKWGITLYGLCAPIRYAQRARISNLAASTDLVYLIDFQGSNNYVKNVHIANFGSDAAAVGGVKVTGDRNCFENVHFIGGGGRAGQTGDYSVSMSADECLFRDCIFGSDTWDMGDKVNCNLDFISGGLSARDEFINCKFVSYHSTGTTAGAIRLNNSAAICRNIFFDNCFFECYDEAAAAAEAAVVVGTMPNNGCLVMKDCQRHGYTDWAAAANARVLTNGVDAATDGAGGIMIASNPS